MIAVNVVRPQEAAASLGRQVFRLLREVDEEFCPPLSARADTMSLPAQTDPRQSGVETYYRAVRQEFWLVASSGGSVVGLLSYLTYLNDPSIKEWSPSLYATTVAVSPQARRAGVASTLYVELAEQARRRGVPFLSTRTWTTNDSHIGVLRVLGFTEVSRMTDDRGTGIGTVHFACSVDGFGGVPATHG